jgi:flagella basal body P-ring formation protein FlgA
MVPGMAAEIGAAAAPRVRVSAMTQIDGEQIVLGEIARIESHDPLLIQRIGAVVIGRSPLPGKRRAIDANLVKRRLKQNRIDPEQLVLQIPARIVVERSFIEIGQEKLKGLVSDYISQNLIDNLSDARIKDIQVAENLVLPSTIEIFTRVVVTKKPLGRHKPITEDDIEMQKMDLAQLPSDVITDPEVVLGQRTRRAIGSHTVLRSNLVEFPPLVRRGDVVVILAETGGLKITTVGQVKKKGRLGERIPVMNFDSKKVLYARVLDANTVKVEF